MPKVLLWPEEELVYQEKILLSFDTWSDHLIEWTGAETLMSKMWEDNPLTRTAQPQVLFLRSYPLWFGLVTCLFVCF